MSVTRNLRVICDECGLFVGGDNVGFRYGYHPTALEPTEEHFHLHGCPTPRESKEIEA